jgi:LysM repeat protein
MGGRSPARFLAPLALVVFALALFLVVSSTTKDGGSSGGARDTSQPAQTTAKPGGNGDGGGRQRKPRRTYTIKTGDTPSGIAERVGVPLDQILSLNPDLDPQTLTPGTKIKLR